MKVWDALPIRQIRPFKGQPRDFFDEESLRALAESMGMVGQCQPVMVIGVNENSAGHTHQLVDGERRYRSAKKAKEESLFALEIEVIDTPETEGIAYNDKLFIIASVANVAKEAHQPLEFARTLAKVRRVLKITNSDELAKMYGQSPGTVTNHLNLLTLCDKVQKLMDPELAEERQLKMAIALLLVGYPEKVQVYIALGAIKNGWTRAQAAHFLREMTREKRIVKKGGRNRKPSDDYKLLETGVAKIDERLLVMVDVPVESIEVVLQIRGAQAKKKLVTDLNRSIRALMDLRDTVQTIELKKVKEQTA